jgi:hypothetical protein
MILYFFLIEHFFLFEFYDFLGVFANLCVSLNERIFIFELHMHKIEEKKSNRDFLFFYTHKDFFSEKKK